MMELDKGGADWFSTSRSTTEFLGRTGFLGDVSHDATVRLGTVLKWVGKMCRSGLRCAGLFSCIAPQMLAALPSSRRHQLSLAIRKQPEEQICDADLKRSAQCFLRNTSLKNHIYDVVVFSTRSVPH